MTSNLSNIGVNFTSNHCVITIILNLTYVICYFVILLFVIVLVYMSLICYCYLFSIVYSRSNVIAYFTPKILHRRRGLNPQTGMVLPGKLPDQFLAALQPYKSPCPPLEQKEQKKQSQNFKSILSLVIKTKLVQNVNRMLERQKDRPTDSLTDRQTDRQTERQIEDKTTFQLSYQNKTCSEC